MVRSLTNWIWLVEFSSHARALDATDAPTADVAASLRQHFPAVSVVRRDESALSDVRASAAASGWHVDEYVQGRLESGPWAAGSFDCIVMHDVLSRDSGQRDPLRRTLAAARRLLRPGGWLQLTSANRSLRRSRSAPGALSRRNVARLLRRAGFGEVRTLHVASSIERSLHLIPDRRGALLAFESSDAMRGATSRVRQAIARVGPRSMLYTGYMLLARA